MFAPFVLPEVLVMTLIVLDPSADAGFAATHTYLPVSLHEIECVLALITRVLEDLRDVLEHTAMIAVGFIRAVAVVRP